MNRWTDWAKKLKKEQVLILLLAGVLLLVISIPTEQDAGAGETENTIQETVQEKTDREILEERLTKAISQVEGVGKTEVMITLKSDGRRIVEKDTERSEGRDESGQEGTASVNTTAEERESTVYASDGQGGEVPYVTETLEPEIAGVLIVAQGGGDMALVQEITEAVMALFGVEAHKIKVMKME